MSWFIPILFSKLRHLFTHLVHPEDRYHQLIPFTYLPFAISLDFDANNIFRAFFGGHGGGYSFDSSPGVFYFSSLMTHLRSENMLSIN